MYIELTVVVDGAVEETASFADEPRMRAYLADVEDDAASHGYPVEVYALAHEHDDDGRECACIQYAQDHHPYVTHNAR